MMFAASIREGDDPVEDNKIVLKSYKDVLVCRNQNTEWIPVSQIQIGDTLVCTDAETIPVIDVEQKEDTYIITVEEHNSEGGGVNE